MRSKLKLNLNELRVDSFNTSGAEQKNGTVFGEQCTCYTNCTCPGCPTCYASCNGTCNASCNGTCYDYTCADCDSDYCGTFNDFTCNGYGTCGIYPCKQVP
jgi:hypothetical protein